MITSFGCKQNFELLLFIIRLIFWTPFWYKIEEHCHLSLTLLRNRVKDDWAKIKTQVHLIQLFVSLPCFATNNTWSKEDLVRIHANSQYESYPQKKKNNDNGKWRISPNWSWIHLDLCESWTVHLESRHLSKAFLHTKSAKYNNSLILCRKYPNKFHDKSVCTGSGKGIPKLKQP